MGKTSSAVKNRWNATHYDTVTFKIPKGDKEKIKAAADNAGMSLTGYIVAAIRDKMQKEQE